LDGVGGGELGGGVADGEAGDEGELVGLEVVFDGEGERDGEVPGGGEPGVRAAPAARGLAGGEDDGGGEEVAALAEDGGVGVGGFEGGEVMEPEGGEARAEAGEVEGTWRVR
jgi:hypothetical protein